MDKHTTKITDLYKELFYFLHLYRMHNNIELEDVASTERLNLKQLSLLDAGQVDQVVDKLYLRGYLLSCLKFYKLTLEEVLAKMREEGEVEKADIIEQVFITKTFNIEKLTSPDNKKEENKIDIRDVKYDKITLIILGAFALVLLLSYCSIDSSSFEEISKSIKMNGGNK